MEWTKITITPAELERRPQEYRLEALNMMQRSRSYPAQAPTPQTAPEPKSDSEPEEAQRRDDNAPPKEEDAPKKDEGKAEDEKSGDDILSDTDNPKKDESYGVYTAEEILSSSFESEEMKKAAQMIEELGVPDESGGKGEKRGF